MTLSRDYKISLADRARRDPAFAEALREETAKLVLDGEAEAAALLRNACHETAAKSPPGA